MMEYKFHKLLHCFLLHGIILDQFEQVATLSQDTTLCNILELLSIVNNNQQAWGILILWAASGLLHRVGVDVAEVLKVGVVGVKDDRSLDERIHRRLLREHRIDLRNV